MLKKIKNKMNLKKYLLFLVAVTLFVFGFLFGFKSWNGVVFVAVNDVEGRGIASVHSDSYVVSLSPDDLRKKSHQNLFKKAKIKSTGDHIEFVLGSFLIPNKNNQYQFVCQIYSFLELVFISSDILLSGHKGKLVVQAPCKTQDEELIGSFKIPSKRILENPSQNYFSDEENQSFFRFYETAILLMKDWQLMAVRFFNEEEEDGFVVNWKKNSENINFKIKF